ncbi:MAG: ABC transporter permease subunit [Steroidobacteraceae bacterium]
MRAALIVFAKEFIENLRDRRTVLTALVMGPLFGPLLFSAALQLSLDRGRLGADEAVELRVINGAAAPQLLRYLQSFGVEPQELQGGEAAARTAISSRNARVVLEIPEEFGSKLAAGDPAPLRLYADGSRSGDQRSVARVRALLSAWSQHLAGQRLQVRGLDPQLLMPVALQNIDVSTPAGRSLLLLGMLSFFIILSLLTGGMYLAIDTTVGERERGTLEPLLATPVRRESLLVGKLLATCSYMLLSMSLTTAALFVALGRIDMEQFGMSANLGPGTALALIGVTAPLIPLLGGAMTLVAAFTRSSREAQAWLGVLQLLPTLPLVFASLMNLAPSLRLMLVPSLSQHLLITQLLRGEAPDPLWLAASVGATLLAGLSVILLASRLYRRESLLV